MLISDIWPLPRAPTTERLIGRLLHFFGLILTLQRYARTEFPLRSQVDFLLCLCMVVLMATKTISLEIEAYEKLRRAKRFPRESFSEVVLRASIPDGGVSGRELLAGFDSDDLAFSDEELAAIDALNANDAPPDIP